MRRNRMPVRQDQGSEFHLSAAKRREIAADNRSQRRSRWNTERDFWGFFIGRGLGRCRCRKEGNTHYRKNTQPDFHMTPVPIISPSIRRRRQSDEGYHILGALGLQVGVGIVIESTLGK